jgi:low affinity Fe/Cu permease
MIARERFRFWGRPHAGSKNWAEMFSHMASEAAHWAGKPTAFLIATALVVIWAATGPLFGYSDTWQLVINTSTTIVTFLMVFLIQNTQNRDTMALQLKLSELILVINEAENRFAAAEDL